MWMPLPRKGRSHPSLRVLCNFAHLKGNALTVDYSPASRDPIAGWPSYPGMYKAEAPDSMLPISVFSESTFDNLPLRHSFRRIPMVGPVCRALHAEGATGVDQAGLRICS